MTHATQFLPRCDRVVLVAKGKIVDQGVYQDVFDNNPSFHPILKVRNPILAKFRLVGFQKPSLRLEVFGNPLLS